MKKIIFKLPILVSLLALTTNLAACSTIKSEKEIEKEQIEVVEPSNNTAEINGVGTLFFVIPNVITYAVDFNDGTVYLPNKKNRHKKINDLNISNMSAIKIDKERLNFKTIESIISAEAGGCQIIDISKAQAYRIGKNGKKVKVL